ncbi:MAG: hydroxylamine reductase [Lachnospirales bacterium]
MFCYQCQEANKGVGCTQIGMCGKKDDLATLQDVMIYALKGVSEVVVKGNIDVKNITDVNDLVINSIFMTITNANFDDDAFVKEIKRVIKVREELKSKYSVSVTSNVSNFKAETVEEMHALKEVVSVLATENEDIRSLREMITYGLKGLAAYYHHATNLSHRDLEIMTFVYETLNALLEDKTVDELIALTMKTGDFGVKTMALLDEANTSKYGNPEITEVNIGVRNNPAILISGHDLADLEQLLEQTENSGVDVYTHSEMLPAHYYPFFKKYDNFVGNYGNAWWKQIEEFKTFNGPILFTTNCIVPPRDEDMVKKIFTTGASGYVGSKHIEADKDGKKDFSELIAFAKTCDAPTEIESGKIVGGFAHAQVFALADKVVDAVKTGAIKQFYVMAGCDGRMKSRAYYTDFADQLPKDTVVLTAGCAKYRYNKLNLGDIGGIPRVLDAGQCNDSYSLAVIAMKLKEVFELKDINELPIVYNIAWYEQKAVIVLLALLALGVKNIHLGPTLPAFLSPNVAKVLVDTFGIGGIGTVEEDLKKFTA